MAAVVGEHTCERSQTYQTSMKSCWGKQSYCGRSLYVEMISQLVSKNSQEFLRKNVMFPFILCTYTNVCQKQDNFRDTEYTYTF